MDPELLNLAIRMRLVERAVLIGVVVVLSLVILVAFWRRTQSINLTLSKSDLGLGGSFFLSTPVFVLLTLTVFAYGIVFSSINVEDGQRSLSGAVRQSSSVSNNPVGGPALVPMVEFTPGPILAHLNCALSRAALTAEEEDAMETLRTRFMLQNWQIAWGDEDVFARWRAGDSQAAPSANATQALRWEGLEC